MSDIIDLDVSVNLSDLASGDPDTVSASIQSTLYPVFQAIFEAGGEHRAKIGCHGHHAAQEACRAVVDQWFSYAGKKGA